MEIEIISTNTQKNNTINFGLLLNKCLNQIKMMHWYTSCYNMHLIFGELYDNLNDLFDKLQEEIIGTSRESGIDFPLFNADSFKEIDSIVYTDNEYIIQEFYNSKNKLNEIFNSLEFKNYQNDVKSGLENTKDEIKSIFNKTAYLLNLNKK